MGAQPAEVPTQNARGGSPRRYGLFVCAATISRIKRVLRISRQRISVSHVATGPPHLIKEIVEKKGAKPAGFEPRSPG